MEWAGYLLEYLVGFGSQLKLYVTPLRSVRTMRGSMKLLVRVLVAMMLFGAGPAFANFNLTYENVVENRSFLARLSWQAPETDPDVTAWRLEWKKVGPAGSGTSQQYTPGRSTMVPVPSGPGVDQGASFSVDLCEAKYLVRCPTDDGHDFSSNVFDSLDNDAHVFRVIAVHGASDHQTSEEVRGQYDPNHHLTEHIRSIVEKYPAFPWVGAVYDFFVSNAIPFVHDWGLPAAGTVKAACHAPCIELEVREMTFKFVEPIETAVIHEFGHVYSFGLVERQGPVAVAYLYFFDLWLGLPDDCAAEGELIADMFADTITGDTGSDWQSCLRSHPQLDTDEARTVISSAISGQMSDWFHTSPGDTTPADLSVCGTISTAIATKISDRPAGG